MLIGYAISDGGFHGVHFANDVGGTVEMPKGRYRVKIVKEFDDYETGHVMHGILLDKKDIETARKVGTTVYSSDKKTFLNPPKVMFYSTEFEEE